MLKRYVADGEKETSPRRRLFLCIGSDRKSLGCKHLLEPVTNTFILEAMSSIVDRVWFVTVQCSSQTHKAPASRNGPNSDPTTCWLHGLDQITQVIFSAEKCKFHRFSCAARGSEVCICYGMARSSYFTFFLWVRHLKSLNVGSLLENGDNKKHRVK